MHNLFFNYASNGYKMNSFSTIEQMTPFGRWLEHVQTTWSIYKHLRTWKSLWKEMGHS